jgi:hypothetical protein
MTCCNHCVDANKFFSKKTAQRDIKKYRKKGPNKSTRLMLDPIREKSLDNLVLLDIGGGIGAISFELFKSGIKKSIHVDASDGYLQIAEKEADNRELKQMMEFYYGDFTDLVPEIEPADIVTLDRVICCYPDREKLIEKAAEKSLKYLGLVYPRDRVGSQLVIAIGNGWFKFRGSDFRTYIHEPELVDQQIRGYGFTLIKKSQMFLWESAVYERNGLV